MATAVRKMDIALAQAGMTRSERKALINEFKASTPGAAGQSGMPGATGADDMQDAVVNVEPGLLLAGLKDIQQFLS